MTNADLIAFGAIGFVVVVFLGCIALLAVLLYGEDQ